MVRSRRSASSDTFLVTALVTQTTDLSSEPIPAAILHTRDDPQPSKPLVQTTEKLDWDLTPKVTPPLRSPPAITP